MQFSKIPLPVAFFVGGFLLDLFTLGRVDDSFNMLMFSGYTLLSFACLYLMLRQADDKPLKTNNRLVHLFQRYNNEIFHYCQGSLLSAFTLIFFKSASLSASFFFMLIFAAVLLANEVPFIQQQRLITKTFLAHLTLLSFCVVYVPMMIGFLNIFVTLCALAFYLGVLCVITSLLHKHKISDHLVMPFVLKQGLAVTLIFLLFRLANILPPVPLSLQSAGIYHQVVKQYPRYLLKHQKPWWKFWHRGDQLFRARPGDKLYFFTEIFAPRGFKDQVFVTWQFYQNGSWQTSDRIPMPITGGREKGFRGFAYKSNYPEGDGRIMVETTNGQEIGRLSFEVIKEEEAGEQKQRSFFEDVSR